jgi:hypothetical protein
VFGAERLWWDCWGGGTTAAGEEKGIERLSPRASWIEGSDLAGNTGDSFSSLVDLRVECGGEIYPDIPGVGPAVDTEDEYDGGGPEYIVDVVGLPRGADVVIIGYL